ncbi:MAG: polysaccharide biosynthesis tyrosine autokinase [Steroidobacteraceae bacterium]
MSIAVEAALRSVTRQRSRLGELLVAAGALCESDVARIVAAQRERSERFGTLALEMKLIGEEQLQQALASQVQYPFVATGDTSLSPLLAAAFDPFGEYAESIRTLRSQLLLRWFGAERSLLAISSARDDAGAAVVSANLAIAWAQMGANTLLIDANLRAPRQHHLFGLSVQCGLAEVLNRQCHTDDARHAVAPFDNLTIIPAGARFPNPQEALSGSLFSHLLAGYAREFAVVLVATPPMLAYADAALVVGSTRGCLLATRRHETATADLQRARAALAPTSATLVGVVISD